MGSLFFWNFPDGYLTFPKYVSYLQVNSNPKTRRTMNIHEHARAIHDILTENLVAGNFDYIEHGAHTAKLRICGYQVEVWIANTQPEAFGFYMLSERADLFDGLSMTEPQKEKAWEQVKDLIDQKEEERRQESIEWHRKRLEELQNQDHDR